MGHVGDNESNWHFNLRGECGNSWQVKNRWNANCNAAAQRGSSRPGGDATVTISHRCAPKEQLKKHSALADIVISAAGIPNLITADMIKEGAAVTRCGNKQSSRSCHRKAKLVGDVDFEGVQKKAGYIALVPGGVGPMTVAMLMKNTIIAAKKVLRPEGLEALKSKQRGVATI